jgi:succinyl-CoA synthetase beta subunit
LGLVLDRASAQVVFMASQAGGMEIEEVAKDTPEKIFKEYVDPAIGFQPYQARKLAFKLGLAPAQIGEAARFMMGMYKAFIDTDSTLMEINPFITTKDGKLLALDCKMNFDDNAMFRHKDLKELRDISEEDPLEVEASKFALNYIKHGEWRGAGDGDDGHHSVCGRVARELSGCWWRGESGAD